MPHSPTLFPAQGLQSSHYQIHPWERLSGWPAPMSNCSGLRTAPLGWCEEVGRMGAVLYSVYVRSSINEIRIALAFETVIILLIYIELTAK